MAGPMIARGMLYFALAWSVFVIIKGFKEAYLTASNGFKLADTTDEEWSHKRAHIVLSLGAGVYLIYNIFSYVYFDIGVEEFDVQDRSIGIFNLFFLNYYLLNVIDHFKQERIKKVGPSKMSDLFKF
jgi:hypothetical protein